MYIPQQGPDSKIRSFIIAFLEMLRRWQWNLREFTPTLLYFVCILRPSLVRLENEHIGNIDQYRITREVPLPYQDRYKIEDEGDDEGEDDGERPTCRSDRLNL